MASKLVGASVWEEGLYEHLISHEHNERELLAEYQKAADELQSPAFQYLVAMIVEDEIRHHRLFRDLAEALKSEAELRPEQPAVPRLYPLAGDGRRLREVTDQLLEREHADARELRRLSKELHDVKDTTLWDLLVRLMEMDTERHVAILEFAQRHGGKS